MGWLFFGFFLYFLIVLSERALVAVSPFEVEAWRSSSSAASRRLANLATNLKATLGALLNARLFTKTVITVLATLGYLHYWVAGNFEERLQEKGIPNWLTEFLVYTIYIGVLSAIFWAIKKIKFLKVGSPYAASILERLAILIAFLKICFSPFEKKDKSNVEHRESGQKPQTLSNEITHKPEQYAAVSNKQEMEMLKSIVKFSDVTVKQVMQPRSKVVAVDFQTRYKELIETVRTAGFSRIPVFDDDLDNVTGILYVKDLVPYLEEDNDFEWQKLIRPNLLLVPESKRISELLRDFKKQKVHLAVVVDEYGGSEGIVTMEDILEEVTGDIQDEFDEESDVSYQKLDDNNYLFEARTLLNDVCRVTGMDSNIFESLRGDADTLAGLALEINGDIPKKGTEIQCNGVKLTITAADYRRIEQIKLTL